VASSAIRREELRAAFYGGWILSRPRDDCRWPAVSCLPRFLRDQ
jgi:hypothetical protein